MFRKVFNANRHNFRRMAGQNNFMIGAASIASSVVVYTSKEADCDVAMITAPIVNLVPPTIQIQKVSVEKIVADETFYESVKNKTYQVIKNVSDMTRYIGRLLTYALYGAPLMGLLPATSVLGETFPGIEHFTWDYMTWAITQLGPCFIKLAQWISTRPDLFPPKLIQRIECLQSDVQVHHSFATVENTITKAFGKDWKDILKLDPVPLGAGSVAQVFKGTIKRANETIDVAVKMIHPHVQQLVETDMELLTHLANWFDTFPSLEILSLGESCRQFAAVMHEQLDLTVEAKNLSKFGKKFAHEKWASFPAPVDGYISKNVLVETYMEGTSIQHFMKMKSEVGDSADKLKLKLSDLGCRLILKMIFFDNFIHGDLHPGNMMVRFNNKGEPSLAILDCGIVYQSRTEAEHKRLVDICLAFMKHDGRLAARLMLENVNCTHNTPERNKLFEDGIQQIVLDCEKENYFEHMAEYFMRVCDLAREHNVRLDPGYFKICMALKVAEGIALSLNKNLDLVSTCVPIVLKAQALQALGIEKFPLPDDEDIVKSMPVKDAKKK